MVLSRAEAYEILELPIGAGPDSICTSYKRLAMKWHPEKHTNAQEATKKFHRVSLAFKRLSTDDESVQLNINQTFELFQQTFYPKNTTPYSNGYYSSEDETTSDEDDDDDDVDYLTMFTGQLRSKQDNRKNGIGSKHLSAEDIEKNANELITEEEKEKRRAEKRRAKKKRRRDKKRAEKLAAEEDKKGGDDKKRTGKVKDGIQDEKNKKKDKKGRGGSSGSEAEEFDTNAAFFTQVVNKKKKSSGVPEAPATTNKPKSVDGKDKSKSEEEQSEDLDPIVLRSRQLAIRGNEMANLGHYSAAIDLFSEAIKLDPRDFRFFGNRSYCFDRMSQHERALKDADKAVHLAPDWPKGYFRKGRALAGLKLYAEAEQAFMQVLKLDRNCEDAMAELLRVRTYQLTEMGFSRHQAEQAIRQHDTVQQALDSLLTGVGKIDLMAGSSLASEVYVSDEEDYVPTTKATSPQISPAVPSATSHQTNDSKQEKASSTTAKLKKESSRSGFGPANPEGLTALWVGNVLPEVTDKKLIQMFSKFGTVTSVRCLPDKYCAFVNFKNKDAAGRAMQGLQGVECAGQRLLIKFPDNPICNGNVIARKGSSNQSNSKRQPNASKTVPQPTPQASSKSAAAVANGISAAAAAANASVQKLTGPVNGDECYFWRTTGCQFGKNCHYRHLPEHKGIDRKPWQRVK